MHTAAFYAGTETWVEIKCCEAYHASPGIPGPDQHSNSLLSSNDYFRASRLGQRVCLEVGTFVLWFIPGLKNDILGTLWVQRQLMKFPT